VVLFEALVQVGVGPMLDHLAQQAADRRRVGPMTDHRHPVGEKAEGRPGRTEECLRRLPVAVLGQQRVNQVPVAINCLI